VSRKPTTGRFSTREELTYAVWWRYLETDAGIEGVAKICGISPYTANRILFKKEGYDAYLKAKPAPASGSHNSDIDSNNPTP
jgi:hypothetical protein